nr:SAM-dependent methyltransferase [Kribbella catacumbae]
MEDILTYPHSAMVWNWASVGGRNNFPAERDLGEKLDKVAPGWAFSQLVAANEAFVFRAVAELQSAKVTQFIDLGSGLPANVSVVPPTAPASLYGRVLGADQSSKVVYVDYDPIVLAHTRALRDVAGQVLVIEGDIFQPKEILDNAKLNEFLDWQKPIGLICTAVLHEHPGTVEEVAEIMAAYVDRLRPDSYTAISHFLDTEDEHTETIVRPLEAIMKDATGRCRFRTLDEIRTFFPGQEIQDPGVVQCRRWRNPESNYSSVYPGEPWSGAGIAGGIGRVLYNGEPA